MHKEARLSTEDLKQMRHRTLSAIRAEFGDHPLFGILDNVEKMLADERPTRGSANGHDTTNGNENPAEYIRARAHAYLSGKDDMESGEVVKGLRASGVELPAADKKAVFKIAALMAKDKDRFEKIKGKAPTYKPKWRAL